MGAFDDILNSPPVQPGGGGAFDDILTSPPAQPKRQVPPLEAARRMAEIGSSAFWETVGFPMAGLGLSMERTLPGMPEGGLSEPIFGFMRSMAERQANLAFKENEELPWTSKAAAAAGGAFPILMEGVMTGNLANAARVPQAVSAARPLVTDLARAFTGAVEPARTMATQRAEQLQQQGVEPGAAWSAAALEYPVNLLGTAAPITYPGGIVRRAVTGGGANIITGEAGRRAARTGLEATGYAPDVAGQLIPTTPEDALTEGLFGAAMGAILGPRPGPPVVAPGARPSYERARQQQERVARAVEPAIREAATVYPEATATQQHAPMSVAEVIARATGAPIEPESWAARGEVAQAAAEARNEREAMLHGAFRDVPPYEAPEVPPASQEQAVAQAYAAAGIDPRLAAMELRKAQEGAELRTPPPERMLVSDEDVAQIARLVGETPEAIRGLSPATQQKLRQTVLAQAVQAGEQPPIQLGQASVPMRGPETVTIGTPGEPGTQAGVDAYLAQRALEARQAEEAVRVAEAQRARKEAALPRGLRTEEVRAGGTASKEGTAALKPEGFPFIGVKRDKKGNVVSVENQVEVLGETTMKDKNNKDIPALLIRRIKEGGELGEDEIVPADKVETLARPKGPRFAQDIEATTYAPPKGVGLGPQQPAPRKAGQRITPGEPQRIGEAPPPKQEAPPPAPPPAAQVPAGGEHAPTARQQQPGGVEQHQGNGPLVQGEGEPRNVPPGERGGGGEAGGGHRVQQGGPLPQVPIEGEGGGGAAPRTEGGEARPGLILTPPEPKAAATPSAKQPAQPAPTGRTPQSDALIADIIDSGGLKTAHALDITGEKAGLKQGGGRLARLFRKDGLGIDELATRLWEKGWLTDQDLEDVDGGSQKVRDMVRDAMAGELKAIRTGENEEAMTRAALRSRMMDDLYAEAERLGLDTTGLTDRQVEDAVIDATAAEAARDPNTREGWARMSEEEKDAFADAQFGIGAAGKKPAAGPASEAPKQVPGGHGPGSGEVPSGEPGAQRPHPEEGGAAAAPAGERPPFELAGESPDELRARAALKARQAAEARAREAAPPPEDFTLTGSTRPADEAAARGAQDLRDAANEARDLGDQLDQEQPRMREPGEDEGEGEGGAGTLYANPLPPVFKALKKLLWDQDAADEMAGLGRTLLKSLGNLSPSNNPLMNVGRFLFQGNASNMRVAARHAEKTNPEAAKVLHEIADVFDDRPGAMGKRGGMPTFGQFKEQWLNETVNRFWNALGEFGTPGKRNEAALKQIGALLENRKNITKGTPLHDAAANVAKLLDEVHDWLKQQGIDIGYEENYNRFTFDNDKILADPNGFLAAAERAYEKMGLRGKERKDAAEALLKARVMGAQEATDPAFVQTGSALPRTAITKKRTLTPEARRELREFRHDDLGAAIPGYLHAAARLGTWQRYFGGPEGSTQKWQQWEQRLFDAGGSESVSHMRNLVQSATGDLGGTSSIMNTLRRYQSVLRTANVLSFLAHTVMTSVPEPGVAAARTGNPMDLLRAYGGTAQGIWNRVADKFHLPEKMKSASAEERRDIAELVGAVLHRNSGDFVLASQVDGEVGTRGLAPKAANKFLQKVGLRAYTDASIEGSGIGVGGIFIRQMAERALKGEKLAREELGALGVADKDIPAFADYVTKANQGNWGGIAKEDIRGGMGQLYKQALHTFSGDVIMSPKKESKAYLAQHPVAATAYGLLSYQQEFTRRVLGQAGRRTMAGLRGEGYSARERARLLAAPAMASLLPIINYMLIPLRDQLWGDTEKKREEYDKPAGTIAPMVTKRWAEALSRAGMWGNLDPVVNMITGAKYERPPESILLGPYGGQVSRSIMETLQLIGDKNAPTNTQERQLAKILYQTAVAPALSGLSVMSPIRGAGVVVPQILNRNAAKEWFARKTAPWVQRAENLVGAKEKVEPTGKSVKQKAKEVAGAYAGR